jgi:hypothetical protein
MSLQFSKKDIRARLELYSPEFTKMTSLEQSDITNSIERVINQAGGHPSQHYILPDIPGYSKIVYKITVPNKDKLNEIKKLILSSGRAIENVSTYIIQ